VILLPIWGFFAGFQFGATIFTDLFGQGFFSTACPHPAKKSLKGQVNAYRDVLQHLRMHSG
jgi:hypothetical protein